MVGDIINEMKGIMPTIFVWNIQSIALKGCHIFRIQ